jgi:4-coumarate--CoA ligase
MLFSGNSIFSPVVIMGTIMAGGIYTSGNPAFKARELAYQLKDSGASFLLAADNCVDRALDGARLAGLESSQVFFFHDLDARLTSKLEIHSAKGATESWTRLIQSPSDCRNFQWEQLDTPELANRTMVLFYSSGTTGLPKGVEASHYNIVSNICQLDKLQHPKALKNSGLTARGLCFLPMYHGLGLVYYSWIAPKRHLPVYMMVRFDLAEMLSHIQHYKITELLMVPPVLIAMTKHPLVTSGRYDLSSIQKVLCGAAPLGMEVTLQFEKLWPHGALRVRQAYGMSE